ncbi:MAG: hypothetical protein JJT95_01800 [Pararhodobacter sp.]|nr:hypothetical protein [Pararhodobacter sp.]
MRDRFIERIEEGKAGQMAPGRVARDELAKTKPVAGMPPRSSLLVA